MRKRRTVTSSAKPPRPRSKPRQSKPIRRPRDPLAREWVSLTTSARALGLDWRTFRKHIADEDFVRVLGPRWYVRHAELVAWWERQRPRTRAAIGGRA